LSSSIYTEQLELSSPVLALRKASANSHVAFGGAYYSFPHTFYGDTLIVRATKSYIDILDCNGACIASHLRTFVKHKYITDPSHLPDFSYYLLWADRFVGTKLRKWADKIGDNTFMVIDTMLAAKPFEEHAFRSCLAVLMLSKKFGSFILEKACGVAVSAGSYNLSAIQKLALVEHDKRFNISR